MRVGSPKPTLIQVVTIEHARGTIVFDDQDEGLARVRELAGLHRVERE
jgi:hypothetical protein